MARILILGSLAESLVIFRRCLLEKMIVDGHQVFACAPNASIEVREQLSKMRVTYCDVNLQRTGINPFSDFVTLYKLIQLFKKVKPDIFLGYTIKPVIYGSLMARFCGVPKIYSMIEGVGYAFLGTGLKSKIIGVIASNLFRFALRFNEKVFFLNPDNLEMFLSKHLLRDEQAVILNGIGVDLDKFNVAPYPKSVSFLLVARLLRDKGVCEYADAARIIKQKYPQVKFRLVGFIDAGNPATISEEELDSWINSGVIDYLGRLSDVRPAITESSVYVLPSYHEGMPVTVMEAMAMGRPIITTDVPGCRETVRNGENGFLVPVRDVPSLVQAIESFIKYPSNIESMGKESRQIAVKKYDVHKINVQIMRTMDLV